jgi:uncharacterized RDD family membrane protein YckC
MAGFVDLALASTVVATLVLLRLASVDSPPLASALVEGVAGLWSNAYWLLAGAMLAQVLFWTYLGATPGMLLLGSQVVRAHDAKRLALVQSIVRCAALWIGLACLGVGVLWIIWDPRHRGLHDKVARCVVVKEDESLMSLDELQRGVQ